MGPSFRLVPQHGSRRVVVRGTVREVIPGRTIVRLWIFKKTILPKVEILIDDSPYRELYSKFKGDSCPVQDITITWGRAEHLTPKVGMRAWVTFAYAGELESFFTGALPFSLCNIEVIGNETDVREHELAEPQIQLLPPVAT